MGSEHNSIEWSKLVVTSLIVIAGWFVTNYINTSRDQTNMRHTLNNEYLIKAYRIVANASMRDPQSEPGYITELETAISDIQLFGTQSQINKTHTFLTEFKEKGHGSLDPLINDLRASLRKDLELPSIEGNVQWFRPKGAPSIQ